MNLSLHHDWDSFQSLKVRLCLTEKRLPWTAVRVPLAEFANLRPDYLALNPLGLVPTLVADEFVLTESSVINEFLEDSFAHVPLRPEDPRRRAAMRVWIKFQDDVVHPAVRIPTFNLMLKQRVRLMSPPAFELLMQGHPMPERAKAYRTAATADIDFAAVEASLRAFQAILTRLDKTLRHDTWLTGTTFSLADIALATLVNRIDRLEMSRLWSPFPDASRWREKIIARDAYQQAIAPAGFGMPSPDPDVVNAILNRLD